MRPNEPHDDDTVQRLAEAVADGQPVDWSELAPSPTTAAKLRNLREIETISQLYHKASERTGLDARMAAEPAAPPTSDEAQPGTQALGVWGSHVLLERIGHGAFGDVFRAFDASLRRHVAIKLLNDERPGARRRTQPLLEEARRLAQVRHPSVITVHGVETHDGKSGIRTELLEGRTLEECVHTQGLFSAQEAALIGIELCGALAAIHAQRIVHGDIKTTNVIREDGGRIVLMDFGSAREEHPDTAESRSVTPLVTAPEVLRGEQATRAADLYQLGALLYRLVTASYLVESDDLDTLRAKLVRGDVVPLRDRRAGIPAAFAQVVSRATQADPRARFNSAGEMEQALQETLGSRRTVSKGGSRRRNLVGGVALLAVLVTVALAGGAARWLPGGALRMNATLYRVDGVAHETIELDRDAALRPGDTLMLTLESREDVHVYVLNEGDHEPGTVNTLFPDPDLTVRNPVAGGIVHQLPARSASEATWEVSGDSQVERLLIVASREPLLEFEGRVSFANHSGASPGFDVDPSKVDDLGLRSIELRKRSGIVGETALAYLEKLLVSRAQKGDVWYELLELECEIGGNGVREPDATMSQGR